MNTQETDMPPEHTIIGFQYDKIKPTKLTRYFPCTPFVPGDAAEKNRRCEQILSIQANGLKGRLDHTKSNTYFWRVGFYTCVAGDCKGF